MAKKQFKTESKRLLDLMINSIYTHKEIFLRELISNASDATDKFYFNAMRGGDTGITREQLPITLTVNREKRQLILSDCGCGMTAAELESNLGTIARSGSLAFKQEMKSQEGESAEDAEDIDIIGQFGVGFYAAFMVAKDVKVITRTADGASACWESSGDDGYTISDAERAERGTDIILTIKDNTDTEQYDEYLEQFRLQSIVKKYSDYIRYPIRMEMTHSRVKEGTGTDDKPAEYEDYTTLDTLNSMIPIWKKSKKELTDDDYNHFYKSKFFDYEDALLHIHTSTEGAATYHALLFVPARAPFDYYTKDYEKGLQLYSNGVLIMDKCADLLPDHFSFVRGLVDSADLSLNISRELLQHDRHLKVIAGSLEKKIKSELLHLQKNEREKYEAFFGAFGRQLKYGAYVNYGAHKDMLMDLLLYYSSTESKLVTLEEYVSRMKEGQTDIYYACGESVAKIEALPRFEQLHDKGYEVLCLTDDIDEFCVKMMASYQEKTFKSITESDLDLETEEEKEQLRKLGEENEPVLKAVQDALGDKVKKVQLTGQLKTHACCMTTQGGLSLEMEKVLRAQNGGDAQMRAERVLELNPEHAIFTKLKSLQENGDTEKIATYATILYDQALLIEGMPIDDPGAYANAVCQLLV